MVSGEERRRRHHCEFRGAVAACRAAGRGMVWCRTRAMVEDATPKGFASTSRADAAFAQRLAGYPFLDQWWWPERRRRCGSLIYANVCGTRRTESRAAAGRLKSGRRDDGYYLKVAKVMKPQRFQARSTRGWRCWTGPQPDGRRHSTRPSRGRIRRDRGDTNTEPWRNPSLCARHMRALWNCVIAGTRREEHARQNYLTEAKARRRDGRRRWSPTSRRTRRGAVRTSRQVRAAAASARSSARS